MCKPWAEPRPAKATPKDTLKLGRSGAISTGTLGVSLGAHPAGLGPAL